MNTGIETKRPLKIEYQTYDGGESLPFDMETEAEIVKGNVVTRDEFDAFQVYDNQLEFEKYHGDLNKACVGDNTTYRITYLDYVFTQSMPTSAPCEVFNKISKKVQGDPKTVKVNKLTLEKLAKDTTDERMEELYDEINNLEEKVKEKYDEYNTYLALVEATFEGSDSQKGNVTKKGKNIEFTEALYKKLPYGVQEKLKINAVSSMYLKEEELGN
jgi:hypothetical protein